MAANAQGHPSFLADLPKVEWRTNIPLLQYKGFWLFPNVLQSLPIIETQFKPLPSDILIASYPKTGTTWLKALAYEIFHHNDPNDKLETHNPHQLVPFLEGETFGVKPTRNIDDIPFPRIFSTHLPYSVLPENVKNSGCKIVYVSRNPADTFASSWHFFNKFSQPKPLEGAFDEFLSGIVPVGPFFDHVLGYWKEKDGGNVFFVTYEELKKDTSATVAKISEFLGRSLSGDDIEQVVMKSSFERLSKLGVNISGKNMDGGWMTGIPFSSFFRSGSVGNGNECITPEMMKRLNDMAQQKWIGSGLESKLLVTKLQEYTK